MIAKLTGILDSIGEDAAVVDVAGVGYLLYCSGRTLSRLPAVGVGLSLAVETHVREDHIHLFGFGDDAEREWFRVLMTVQGVGARVALAILTVLEPDRIIEAIAAGDKDAFTRADGVGPKLATRILTELKAKAGGIELGIAAEAPSRTDGIAHDAISALINLGYNRTEAFSVVAQAMRQFGPDASVETLVRAGLRELVA